MKENEIGIEIAITKTVEIATETGIGIEAVKDAPLQNANGHGVRHRPILITWSDTRSLSKQKRYASSCVRNLVLSNF